MPPCDIAVFVKERPEVPYRRAIEHGCHLVYMPVDFYRSKAQLDADGSFLASCSALLVHSRRLGPLLAEHNSAISYVDHPNLHGLAEKPPYRPDGFRLWVGDFLNLPYLLRWCAETGQSDDLRILTNARRTSLRGMAMAIALARRLGVELDVRADCVNGIPMDEWNPLAQRELMASARAALDIKGGEHEFAQYTKPPTKAHQFIVSGIPFATNNGRSPPFTSCSRIGFRHRGRGRPRALALALSTGEPRRRSARSSRSASDRRPWRLSTGGAWTEVAARGPARRLQASRPPPVRAFARRRRTAGHACGRTCRPGACSRGVGASWEDAAPRAVLAARAIYRDHVPGVVEVQAAGSQLDPAAGVAVSVLVDLASEQAAEQAALSDHIPDTWEIVAHSQRSGFPRTWVSGSSRSARWPAAEPSADRAIAAGAGGRAPPRLRAASRRRCARLGRGGRQPQLAAPARESHRSGRRLR